MDITVMGITGLTTALVGIGFEVALVRYSDSKTPDQTPVHVGGETPFQASVEAFGLIANGSSNANSVPPFSAHIQVQGNCLTGSKRSVRSPWLEVEAVQAWVRANQ
jgi:hypothetical protein